MIGEARVRTPVLAGHLDEVVAPTQCLTNRQVLVMLGYMESIGRFDLTIHAPKRLAVMGMLNAGPSEFRALAEGFGVTESDLSKVMKTLVGAGYVDVAKTGSGPGSTTKFAITVLGREALRRHVDALNALVDRSAGRPRVVSRDYQAHRDAMARLRHRPPLSTEDTKELFRAMTPPTDDDVAFTFPVKVRPRTAPR